MFKFIKKNSKKGVKKEEVKDKKEKADNVEEEIEEPNELKRLLKKNIKLNEEILEYSKKINKHLLFARVLSYIKIFLILVPIVLGLIFLPKVVDPLMRQYYEVLNIKENLNLINTDYFLKILNKQ